MSENCPFCAIETQAERILWSDELTVTFLSNPRLIEGHTLVVPRRHVEKPWDLTSPELQSIFTNLWKVEQKLITGGVGAGCDIRQNYRPFMPQGRVKVDHVHFHALPRKLNDTLYETSMRFEVFEDMSPAEREWMEKLLAL
ncbi:MAG: HIT family protein [Candidatus Saccharibacteria bacterium]